MNSTCSRALLICVLGATIFARPAQAAGPYDPEVPYFTLTTPHFLVMYPDGYGHIALRAAHLAEDARPYFVRRYGWDPDGKISIIINDQTDFANGSATILPNKVITLYVTAPTRVSGLEEYDDWLSSVLIHEMAHIFHLDMAYGLPWLGRWVLGKYVAMNQYTPAWSTEGFAVYEETVSTGGGRGRSTYVDMVMRTAALADQFPTVDQGYRGFPQWPFSNVAYFLGGRFQLWLTEKYGEAALIRYHQVYAANPIPYLTYVAAKIVFDTSIEALWRKFAEEMTAEAHRQKDFISQTPLTEVERLSYHGGESLGPRYTPDGKNIVFSTSSPVDGPRVRIMDADGQNDRVLLNDTLSETLSFTPDGRAFYFQQTEINQRFYYHNSLLRYDLSRDSVTKLEVDEDHLAEFLAPSGSLRARDPDLSPDGKRLVFVQSPYGANRLVLAWVESDGSTLHPKVLVPAAPDVQFANPRFSPDGQKIAVSRFAQGRRDVVIYDLAGNLLQELTRDRAQDADPTWSPDGRWLVFSSDISRVYNLYAYDLKTQELRQLTNLLTGAFQPSVAPDGQHLVFRGYTAAGFDVFRLPFRPESSPRVTRTLEPLTAQVDNFPRIWPPLNPGAPAIPAPAPFADVPMPEKLPPGWEIEDYSALDTILPFQDNWNLFPGLVANEREIFGSLAHFGSDARQTHSYALAVTYGSLTQFLGGTAVYTNDVLEPTFTFLVNADAVTYANSVYVENPTTEACPLGDQPIDTNSGRRFCYGTPDGLYRERQLLGRFTIGLPVLQRHFFSMSYILEDRRSLEVLPANTLLSQLPAAGRYARVQLGYTYANVRSFPYSISLERGPTFGVALSALSRGLGGDYEQFLLTSEGRYYLELPWTQRPFNNHVLASRLGLGFGLGPDLAQLFRLGGVGGASAITTTTENFYSLRGLSTSALRGTAVVSGSVEYRAPLLRIDRGIGTLPFTARVLHAAAFADFGRVFDKLSLDSFKDGFFADFVVGVGAELRADVILFYGLPLSIRLGYAHPLKSPSASLNAPGPYFQVGSQF